MRLSTALATTLLAAPSVLASEGYHYYSDAELTLMACKGALYTTAQFCPKDAQASYACNCKNQAAMGSLMYCLEDKLGKDRKDGEEWFIEYCHELNVTLTESKLQASLDNATNYIIDPSKTEGFNKTAIGYLPVKYAKKSYTNYFNSLKARWRNISDSMFMGAGLLGYWAFIFLVAAIYNFLNRVGFVQKHLKSDLVNQVRRHLTLPSLFSNKRHSHPIQVLKVVSGFIPTRLETIILFLYFVMVCVFSSVGYHYIENNTIWKARDAQMARYPGDRTGILLIYSLQLTFLFVGRNNFLLWLTGWKQATFYTYHKWISRMNFLMMLVHAGAMHVQSVSLNKFHSRVKTQWYQYGIAAGIIMGLMLVLACYRMRKASYEVFVLCHIALAATFVATSWLHCKQFEYQMFFYSITAIWVFDRFMRVARLFAFGVQDAQVTVVSDEILKVVVPKRSYWKAFPGAFGYVHFLRSSTFFQSHPFTIVENHSNEIVFYSKIKGGITSSTHKYLSSLPGKTGTIKVSVEGPYGNPVQMKRYDTVLLYAGGTGIASPFSHALRLVELKAQQHIKLYWTIKTTHSLAWFKDELQQLRGTAVKIIIYVTRPDSINSSTSDSDEKNAASSDDNSSSPLKDLDFVEFRYGRADLNALIKADLEESNGTVSILTTAHNSFVDDVRDAVRVNLGSAKGRVDYYEDLQVW